jgi:outer membrane protein TolC
VPARTISLFFAFILLAAPLLAEEQDTGDHRVGLTLMECVERAFVNNLSLQNSRQALESVNTTVEGAKGAFDPSFFSTLDLIENISPSSSAYDNIIGVLEYERRNYSWSTGFTGQMATGANYTLALNLGRTWDPSSSQFLLFHPLLSNNVGLTVRQPLLKGGWTTYARSDVIQAGINSQSEALNLETALNDILFQTVQAYWNMVFTLEDQAAKETSLSLAKDLLRINTQKKEEGVFSKIEVLEARSEVAQKQEQLITANNAVRSAEDALKRLILPFTDSDAWGTRISPLTEAEEAKDMEFDMDLLMAEALEKRPDFLRLKLDLKNREVDLLKARNELMPQLDLSGEWRYNALGSNFGNVWDDIVDRSYRYLAVGVDFSYPIGNRTAHAAVRRSEIEYQRALTTMRELEVEIVHELREAVREIILQYQRYKTTSEALVLSTERYNGEVKRLEAGISIPFQVREAERTMVDDTVIKARALLDYQIALARLKQARGTLLSEYGISVPFPELREYVGYSGL